jgi:hypothetical protein
VKNSVNHLRLDTREDTQTGNVGSVKALCDMEFGDRGRAKDEGPIDTDAETVDLGDRFAVGTGKGLEFCRGDLCATVAAVKTVVKEEADFRDSECSCDDERAQEVIDTIGLKSEDGRLGAGENDGLSEVLHHERERRSRVSERVCSMENDEAVEQVIVLFDARSHGVPVMGGDGARVEQRAELDDSIANMAVVCCSRGTKTVNLDLCSVTNSREGAWVREVVE